MRNKKVLIVTYYWPPSGGSGVQRWLKFVKYLPAYGWTPYVVTPEAPSFTIQDKSLGRDVPPEAHEIRLPIREPNAVFFSLAKFFGRKKPSHADFVSTGKKTAGKKILSWIRGNFFIPDARKFWVKPAVRYLRKFIAAEGIDLIVTTGPPHSMHLIGLALKKENPSLRWIADFRDPWSEWDLLDTFALTERSRRAHRRLEQEVLKHSDRVITIAPHHVGRFEFLSDRHVDLVTNGYDEEDFAGLRKVRTGTFTITHVGIVDELRDPRPFIEVLDECLRLEPGFAGQVSLQFVGHVNAAFREYVALRPAVNQVTSFIDHVPHAELLRIYGSTDLQLLVLAHTVLAPGNLPGKFFEYLASGNPILGIGPRDGDAAAILRQTGAGEIFERNDREGIRKSLMLFFSQWKSGTPAAGRSLDHLSRRKLTGKLAQIFEEVSKS